jgi:hypothetical protein
MNLQLPNSAHSMQPIQRSYSLPPRRFSSIYPCRKDVENIRVPEMHEIFDKIEQKPSSHDQIWKGVNADELFSSPTLSINKTNVPSTYATTVPSPPPPLSSPLPMDNYKKQSNSSSIKLSRSVSTTNYERRRNPVSPAPQPPLSPSLSLPVVSPLERAYKERFQPALKSRASNCAVQQSQPGSAVSKYERLTIHAMPTPPVTSPLERDYKERFQPALKPRTYNCAVQRSPLASSVSMYERRTIPAMPTPPSVHPLERDYKERFQPALQPGAYNCAVQRSLPASSVSMYERRTFHAMPTPPLVHPLERDYKERFQPALKPGAYNCAVQRGPPASSVSMYDRRPLHAMTTPSVSSSSKRSSIEICPGLVLPFWGTDDTQVAIKTKNIAVVVCSDCSTILSCIKDARFVICPDCQAISSVLSDKRGDQKINVEEGGVALGFKPTKMNA